MLEEFLTNMTFSTAMIAAIVGGLVLFSLGRASRGMGAKKRESGLKRDLLESKASVPQLESTIRNRDQLVSRLEGDVKELNDRTTDLLRGQDETTRALSRSEREVKNLNSELNAVRGHRQDDNSIIMDGFDDDAPEGNGESAAITRLKKVEALYDKLKDALINRDSRIEELETQLAGSDVSETTAPHDDSEAINDATRGLETKLESKESAIQDLQVQLSEIQKEKEMLEDLASRRSKSNRALKDSTAEIEAKVPTLEKEIQNRDDTIATREASIKRMLGELETAREEELTAEKKIDSLNNNLKSMTTEVETGEHKLLELKISVDRREERITALDSELAATLDTVLHLQEQVREADACVSERQIEIDGFNDKLNEKDQARQALESSLKDRDFKIGSLTDEISTLQSQLSQNSAALENSRQEAVDAVSFSEKRQEAVSSEVATAEQQIAALKQDAASLQSNLSERDRTLASLKQTLDELEARETETTTRIETLEADLQTRDEQLRGGHEQKQNIDDEKHELEREVVIQRTKVDQADAELREERQSIAVYKSMIADKEFRIETLEMDLKAALAGQPSDSEQAATT